MTAKQRRQQALDRVWEHFIVKKRPFSYSKSANICRYRLHGRAKDATRCAAGVLIPDELYSPELEGLSCGDAPVSKVLREAGYTRADIQFLNGLQDCHDHAAGGACALTRQEQQERMIQNLRELATDYRLQVPE